MFSRSSSSGLWVVFHVEHCLMRASVPLSGRSSGSAAVDMERPSTQASRSGFPSESGLDDGSSVVSKQYRSGTGGSSDDNWRLPMLPGLSRYSGGGGSPPATMFHVEHSPSLGITPQTQNLPQKLALQWRS